MHNILVPDMAFICATLTVSCLSHSFLHPSHIGNASFASLSIILLFQVSNQLFNSLKRLLISDFSPEVFDDLFAFGYFRVGEEVVEKVLQLVHPISQEVNTCIPEDPLRREIREAIVSFQVKYPLYLRLQLPHA